MATTLTTHGQTALALRPMLGEVKNPGHRPGFFRQLKVARKKPDGSAAPAGAAAPKPPLAAVLERPLGNFWRSQELPIPPQPQAGASWLFPVMPDDETLTLVLRKAR